MICDLAETYHIYDYRRVPGRLLGTLVAGLGANSRVYQKMSGQVVPTDTLLLAIVIDELRTIIYGANGKKSPEKIATKLMEGAKPERKERLFNTGADFDKARAALIKEITDGD